MSGQHCLTEKGTSRFWFGHVTSLQELPCAQHEDGVQLQHMCAQGYAWAEDKEHCEEYGRMLSADPTKVSQRAKKRGLPQVPRLDSLHSTPCDHRHPSLDVSCSPLVHLRSAQGYMDCAAQTREPVQMGTLGAGNHYAEIQVIDKVFDDAAARKMGIDQVGQVRHPALASQQQGFSSLLVGSASPCTSSTWQRRTCVPVRTQAMAGPSPAD